MKPEEAIERINEHIAIHRYNEPHAIRIAEALQMAVDALEKQIPMKPINEPINQSLHYKLCQRCKRKISGMEWGQTYCGTCGQAINWLENEE